MITKKTILIILSVLFIVYSCNTNNSGKSDSSENDSLNISFIENPSGFVIKRGVNISHWLSQTRPWSRRDKFFSQEDMKTIKALGYDHIRLPIDEEELWDEKGLLIDSSLEDVHNAINWALEENMRVIVDLHILRSHHFNARNNEGKITLWTDTVAQNNFINLWDTLSVHLRKYPNNMVAYEFMNEPVAPEHEMWNKLIDRAIKAIRKVEPNRVLMMGSNRWQKPFTFPFLKIPEGDKNIILTVHTYAPYFVTHYKAYWSAASKYNGPVTYPGITITKEDYNKYVDTTYLPLVSRIEEEKGLEYFDKNKLKEVLQPAIDRAKELGLQLYCSEFGCLPNVDRKTRLQYYQDITDVFRENNITWANWDYKGDFGIVYWDREKLVTGQADTAITNILVK